MSSVDTHEDRQQVGPESVQSDTSPSCAIKSSSMTAGARVIKVEVKHICGFYFGESKIDIVKLFWTRIMVEVYIWICELSYKMCFKMYPVISFKVRL